MEARNGAPQIIYKETSGIDMRIRRERDEAWKRMDEEFPRVKTEYPDKWAAFGKDGFIAANDDLFAIVDDYKENRARRRASKRLAISA